MCDLTITCNSNSWVYSYLRSDDEGEIKLYHGTDDTDKPDDVFKITIYNCEDFLDISLSCYSECREITIWTKDYHSVRDLTFPPLIKHVVMEGDVIRGRAENTAVPYSLVNGRLVRSGETIRTEYWIALDRVTFPVAEHKEFTLIHLTKQYLLVRDEPERSHQWWSERKQYVIFANSLRKIFDDTPRLSSELLERTQKTYPLKYRTEPQATGSCVKIIKDEGYRGWNKSLYFTYSKLISAEIQDNMKEIVIGDQKSSLLSDKSVGNEICVVESLPNLQMITIGREMPSSSMPVLQTIKIDRDQIGKEAVKYDFSDFKQLKEVRFINGRRGPCPNVHMCIPHFVNIYSDNPDVQITNLEIMNPSANWLIRWNKNFLESVHEKQYYYNFYELYRVYIENRPRNSSPKNANNV